MIYIKFINFHNKQIIYYKNISYDESKNISIVLLKLIFIEILKVKFDKTPNKVIFGTDEVFLN